MQPSTSSDSSKRHERIDRLPDPGGALGLALLLLEVEIMCIEAPEKRARALQRLDELLAALEGPEDLGPGCRRCIRR